MEATRNGYFVSKPGETVRFWFNGEGVGAVRPSVAAFALLMEQQLQQHDDRPGWEDDDNAELYTHLQEERVEFDCSNADEDEGADEANLVMMLVQNMGGLNKMLKHIRAL